MKTTTKETFKPMEIGVNRKFLESALIVWENYLDSASWLLSEMVNFLEWEHMKIKQFMELIECEPENILLRLFELSKKAPKDFDLKKAIELGLVSNEYSNSVLQNIQQFSEAKRKAEGVLKFDLSLLVDEDGLFTMNEKLKSALKERFTEYTKSEKQNQALIQFQKIIDGFNWFAKEGLAKPQSGIPGTNKILSELKVNKYQSGYELNPKLFKSMRWNSLLH